MRGGKRRGRNMSDYIRRESIRNMYACLDADARVMAGQVVIDIDAIPSVEEVPVVDTVERKRERCEYCKDGSFIGQVVMLGNDGEWHKINYCPNCGARMKGADDEID